MGRFTIIIDDDLDTRFRIATVKKRMRLNKAFSEAMELWLAENEENNKP